MHIYIYRSVYIYINIYCLECSKNAYAFNKSLTTTALVYSLGWYQGECLSHVSTHTHIQTHNYQTATPPRQGGRGGREAARRLDRVSLSVTIPG